MRLKQRPPAGRRERDDRRLRLRRGGEHFVRRLAMGHVEPVHEHIDGRIGRQTPGQQPIVCGRSNEPHPAAFLPMPQFVEYAVLAKHHIWVVARMNVFDEENINQPDTQEGGQLSPRRPQPYDPPAAAPGGHDDLLALPPDQRGQLFDERRVTRPVEEEIIDPACERPTNALRILLRPRGESQATCRSAVESCEPAVGGGFEELHGSDVVADPADASKVRVDAGDGCCSSSGSSRQPEMALVRLCAFAFIDAS